MPIKLRFLGATGNVTGSRYLLETENLRLLIDCGLYQEREFRPRNWDPFVVPPETIDALLLTHAHLDHCGLLPKLVRVGFEGSIYCTQATSELARIMLMDSAKIQEFDAEQKKRRHQKEKRKGPYPEVPLYTEEDVINVFPLFEPVEYGKKVKLNGDVSIEFNEAGHIFGSSTIKVKCQSTSKSVLFSGDLGRWNKPILRDPETLDRADYVIMESTYGDSLHDKPENMADQLAEVINSTWKAGGNIVVPSFALERAQEVLYYLNKLIINDRIPQLMVFLDSPMAIEVTKIFTRHPELFDKEMKGLTGQDQSPFDFPGLQATPKVYQSKAINNIKGSIMVIAGSGMCTGGRIKHHLIRNISRPESTILFVGYQARGTLGRKIVDGARKVRILGNYYPVKARVVQLHGFSAHADRDELYRWVSTLQEAPQKVFITHGESEVSLSFARFLRQATKWEVSVPQYQDEVNLN